MKNLQSQNQLKLNAATEALKFVKPDQILGIGSGSTVNIFIDLLTTLDFKVKGAIAASENSANKLRQIGIEVLDPNDVPNISIYVDGADEVTKNGFMIKGGGAALTREKILADLSDNFICIVDSSKVVDTLGTSFALPIEVIPLACNHVANYLKQLGGNPKVRENCITDNGNKIIDVYDFVISNPNELEVTLNNIPGVVSCGVFARNRASKIIVASSEGTKLLDVKSN